MKFSTLTKAQQEILEIVASHVQVNGEPPTIREIQSKATEVTSLRGIAMQLDALEEIGYISRGQGARSIKVNDSFFSRNDKLIDVPLFCGRVKAGMPSLFEEYSDTTIPVKLSHTKGLTNVFAICVRGNSMIDVGIEEGDIAVITTQVNPRNGDIVVALRDDSITLKTFRIVDGYPILFPENKRDKSFKPIVDDFEVKGKLISIIKPQMLEYFQKLRSLV